jgi:hypothetical protein
LLVPQDLPTKLEQGGLEALDDRGGVGKGEVRVGEVWVGERGRWGGGGKR